MSAIPQALERIAALHPDRVPFRSQVGTALTYRDWLERAKQLSLALKVRAGVVPGHRIALLFDQAQWHEYPVAYVATLALGATVVTLPSDASTGKSEVADTHLIVAGGTRSLQMAERTGRFISMKEINDMPCADHPIEWLVPDFDALAEIILTSGTTGRRMAVGCTHRNLSSMLLQRIESPIFGFREESVLVHHIPLGTLAAQRVLLESLRSHGQTSVCVAQPSPSALREAIERFSAKFVGLVPTTARMLIRHMKEVSRVLTSVRWVSIGSAYVDTETFTGLAEIFPCAQIISMYGLTEAGSARIRSLHTERPGAIGKPEFGTQVQIRDEHGREKPVGTVGELWIHQADAPNRFYVDDAEATALAFQDGWVRTGDLARVDQEGYVYLIDRLKDIIVSAGEKVGSFDIEQCLVQHPGVVEAAVFGTPVPLLGERVVAAVVLDESVLNARDARRVLLKHCQSRLGARQIPTRFIILDSLPVGPTGKVLKRQLRHTYGHTPLSNEKP